MKPPRNWIMLLLVVLVAAIICACIMISAQEGATINIDSTKNAESNVAGVVTDIDANEAREKEENTNGP